MHLCWHDLMCTRLHNNVNRVYVGVGEFAWWCSCLSSGCTSLLLECFVCATARLYSAVCRVQPFWVAHDIGVVFYDDLRRVFG